MKYLLAFFFFSAAYIFPYNAVLYNGSGASTHDKYIAMTIAGIVNRDSARLYLLNVYETWSYSKTDEQWKDLYKSRGGVIFDSLYTVGQLIEKFRPYIKGGIIYDGNRYFSNFSGQSFKWQGEYACLIGGLTDRIPVTEASAALYNIPIDDSVLITDSFNNDPPVWITCRLDLGHHIWNTPGLQEEERYLSILNWGIENLLPRCNPAKFYIREITDFTIQQKMFQVNLAGTSSLDFNSMPSPRADVLEAVLNYLHAVNAGEIFHIYGWIHPEPMAQWFAFFGASFHETLLGNLSWHSSFPIEERSFVPKSSVRADTSMLRDKYYLLFIGTEGDAANWNIGFQSGAWLSQQRGSVPLGWGWNLHLMDLCPFISAYYYDTATPNDGFLSVTSPLGYAYPDLWGNDVWTNAVESSVNLMNKYGVKNFYAYKHYAPNGQIVYRGKTINNSFNFNSLGQYLSAVDANLALLFDPMLPTQRGTTAYGSLIFNHVNDGSFYGDASDLQNMASRIINAVKTKPKPFFLLAGYQRLRQDDFNARPAPSTSDINLPRLVQLANLLKSDPGIGSDIEIVTPEYFSVLLRKKFGLTNLSETTAPEKSFELLQNYPNPFNASTLISFKVSKASRVKISVFDAIGRNVKTIFDAQCGVGGYQVVWHAGGMPGGVYFVRLTTDEYTRTIKSVLLK